MQSYVFKGLDDNLLLLILNIIEYGTLGIITYMFYKRNPLVWSVIDTIITFCFMIYLNFELPFNVVKFFYFFNIRRVKQLADIGIITGSFVGVIEG